MSYLKYFFNSSVPLSSRYIDDYERKVSYDEDGNEIVQYLPIDIPSIIRSHGKAQDWSLESLVKAGIDPAFPIYTGYTSRIQGLSDIQSAEASVDALFQSNSTDESSKSE